MRIKNVFIIVVLTMMSLTVLAIFGAGVLTGNWDPVAPIGVIILFMEMVFFGLGVALMENN